MPPQEKVNEILRPSRFQIMAARDLLQKMTQEALAKAAGVSADTIALFEAGHTRPHDSTIAKIQRALEDRGIVFTNGGEPGVKFVPDKAIYPTP
jgi:transcriptional regulator with XRE-family HTH domain